MIIEIYPNPAGQIVRIRQLPAKINHLHLFNSLGQMIDIAYYMVNNGEIELNLDKVDKGIYYIQVTSEKGLYTEHFVVKK